MVALVECYADESESAGAYTVAAYLYTKERAEALNVKWAPIMEEFGKDGVSMPYFHMKDCVHNAKFFKGWPEGRNDLMARKIIAAIRDHASCGLTVSFNLAAEKYLPTSSTLSGQQVTAYAICSYFLLYGARRWVHDNHPDAKIAYFYERGATHSGQAARIFEALYKDAWHRNHFKMSSYAFVSKEHSAGIQSADVLAWQWGKNLKSRIKKQPKLRADLNALLEGCEHYAYEFINKDQIEEFLAVLAGQPIKGAS